jgi:hypothetical protein
MKIENQKIAAQYWAGFPARGLALLAWHSGTVAQPAHDSQRGGAGGQGSPVAPVSAVGDMSTRTVRGGHRARRMAVRLTKGVGRR